MIMVVITTMTMIAIMVLLFTTCYNQGHAHLDHRGASPWIGAAVQGLGLGVRACCRVFGFRVLGNEASAFGV